MFKTKQNSKMDQKLRNINVGSHDLYHCIMLF